MQTSSVFAWVAIGLCVIALHTDDAGNEADQNPGDAVRIAVEDAPELTTEGLLEEDGTIEVPEDARVVLGGRAAVVAEQDLADRLQREDTSAAMVHVHMKVLDDQAYRLAERPETAAHRID